ncbi:hypothetical protein ENSA5_49180 [Enhygromyxa salina]|uniref:Uncharacterized protein n=1 Tax=Enhygromyxa salina TaxID=215803 RepID=A0A2S9XI55_9BACT|nr:hypothetical protein [Enhygromyxa salina]PRP92410.1 hypothetical protein ENSA5_49180 [Enhygromyxa salina]
MTLSIILTTVLNTFATSPDLCADVYLDSAGQPLTDAIGQTFARFCEWAGPDAPRFNSDVCCVHDATGAACWLPDREGQCTAGSRYACEHATVTPTGGVVCYQPFPSVCDFGHCQEAGLSITPGPLGDIICCGASDCTEVETVVQLDDCMGYLAWCEHGIQNVDGTVDCFD